jgi:hypothetical protein
LLFAGLTFASAAPSGPAAAATARATWSALADPAPLTAAEEAAPQAAALARRFNPAMAFPTRDIWPTSVAYAWHDSPSLMARVVAKTGRVVREYVAVAGAALEKDWGRLPDADAGGDSVEYYIDAPGDDRVVGGKVGWLERWRAIMGAPQAVTSAPYPPTQYAHVFWFNRARGLVGVQYWFYYPYDYWINRHEGDWEHVNVILQGPTRLGDAAAYRAVGYQYFFHGFMYEPQRVALTGAAGSHALVFAGGKSRLLFWSGDVSGGSYPFPAYYEGAGGLIGPLSPGDDTRKPKRYIAAEDFQVVVLPEPARVDARRHPGLSWLRVAFFAGQQRVYGNPFVIDWLDRGGPPPQPGRRRDWNAGAPPPLWKGAVRAAERLALPPGWRVQVADLAR